MFENKKKINLWMYPDSLEKVDIICFKKSIFTHKGVVCLSCGLRGGSLWTSLKSPLQERLQQKEKTFYFKELIFTFHSQI